MISPENQDRIDAYLFGKLNPEEKNAFEMELQVDEQLRHNLAIHTLEHNAMKLALQDQLKTQMKAWQETSLNNLAPESGIGEEKKIRYLNWRNLSIAASVLLILGFFCQRWTQANFSNIALLNEGNFNSVAILRAANLQQTIPGRRDAVVPIEVLYAAINDKNFQKADQLLQQIDTTNYSLAMARASVAFGLKDYSTAIDNLQIAIQQPDANTLGRQEAEWQLAMMYLAAGQESTAITKLKQIASKPNHDYQSNAVQMLKKLTSFWRKMVW